MQIRINTDSPEPLFTQLIEQIKGAVLRGELAPGSALPSIRQLANDLGVNNKTVAKAYQLLERDGIIQTRGYRGTVIHPNAAANSTVNLNDWVHEKMGETIAACRQAGATDSELRIAFANTMNSINTGGK